MYNRYQGNSGRYVRVNEGHSPSPKPPAPPKVPAAGMRSPLAERKNHAAPALRLPSFIEGGLGKLLKGSFHELETEDILLLLILYLMYRESGDSELLIMMGAMFLL